MQQAHGNNEIGIKGVDAFNIAAQKRDLLT